MLDGDEVERIEIGNRQHIMEVDKIIIDAIRQQPCLYVTNFNMEQRKRGWKQLSEKLKIKEQHLKIRWHLLVQRYQNDDKFKYAQQMNFVERRHKAKESGSKWPEFEITEEDIMESSPNTEEYVFLEVEDLEGSTTVNTGTSIVKEEKDDEDNDVSNDYKGKASATSPAEFVNSESAPCNTNETSESTFITKHHENSKKINNVHEDTITNKENVSTQAEPVTNSDSKSVQCSPTKLGSAERCEDDIFGELVAAMLKRMDADKKRMVKKEIMNVLLA